MKPRPRPFLPPIDATGDLGKHHRSRHCMATKGFAWKHLPTGVIVQKFVAPTEDVLRIQSGLAEGQMLKSYIAVQVVHHYREWVEDVSTDETDQRT